GGQTFSHVSGPAAVDVLVVSAGDVGATRYFDTEMLALNLTLPGGVMVRESPSKASLGRTSVRQSPDAQYYISSFFDVFTEISLDNGANWSPSVSAPAEMVVRKQVTPFSISCPPDMTVAATGPGGAVVTYPPPTVSGGCNTPPSAPACNPPSGSTFPVGTTVVTCKASDFCGQSVTCSFNVTVKPPPPPEIFFPGSPLLPPSGSVYVNPFLYQQVYANGIVIRNVRHRRFTQNL